MISKKQNNAYIFYNKILRKNLLNIGKPIITWINIESQCLACESINRDSGIS